MSASSTNGPGKPQGYPDLLAKIKQRIRSAQYAALKAVNQELVELYRDIGRMKAFFEAHIGLEKLAPLVREIAWSYNLVILERCKDPLQRELYIQMVRRFGWSRNVLIQQIENQSYQKSLLEQL